MVRLFLVTVLTSLTSALPGFAEHDPLVDHPMLLSSAQAVRSMETGRDLLLRFRLDESEAVMQRLAGEPDGRPAAFYFLAYSSALKSLISDRPLDHRE
ncbi:MAG: hypothetical protein R3178_01390, partial [Rhodothermales bacterium]|nr:hypothetical protein [Rhodothermales bacterium]